MRKYIIAAVIGFLFCPIINIIHMGYQFGIVEFVMSAMFVGATWCLFGEDGLAESLKNLSTAKRRNKK